MVIFSKKDDPVVEERDADYATFDEVVHEIREGTFYDDHDWASGPALRALAEAQEMLALRWQALDRVMEWINNWSPDFVQDPEWEETLALVAKAIPTVKAL